MKNKQTSGTPEKERLLSSSWFKWPVRIAVLMVLFSLLGYAIILYGGRWVVDDDALILDAATVIETPDGDTISRVYTENRTPVSIDTIPDHVQNAFVAIEDRRFRQHAGVDFKAIARAVYKDIIAMDTVEGGSTLTQQLAKRLFLSSDQTWLRKTKEAMAAIYLERTHSKNEILELYLNDIYFGQGVYGIEMAARTFFSKSASDLSVSEGAMLAGLAKAPNGYSPVDHPDKALKRRNTVLNAMEATGYLSAEEKLREKGKTLGLDRPQNKSRPWSDSYIDLVLKEAADRYQISIDELKRGGYRIVAAYDETAQKTAYEQFQNEDYFPGNAEGTEGAFVMIDQSSGAIVAALGGRSYQIGDLNRATVQRQPGSTLKPLAVYGPALMNRKKYDPYSMVVDKQKAVADYPVTNHDNQYEGSVSIYEALVESKNTSAVWLLNEMGLPTSKDYLSKMNLNVPDDELNVALGGLKKGLSPLDMAKGFTAFARNGKMAEPHTILTIDNNDGVQVADPSFDDVDIFSPQVAWDMTEMLSTAVQEGTGHYGEYTKALAGKTGSTQHPRVEGQYKDAWFVGYTPDYVMSTWMGYDHSDETHYLKGGSPYPTRLTKAILSDLDQQQSLTDTFEKPDKVDALEKPIKLPDIQNVQLNYTFGGLTLLRGKLTWSGGDDERIVYRIYKETDGDVEQIGEVEGKESYTIKRMSVLDSSSYYVVPYNPLTKQEGSRSKKVGRTLLDSFNSLGGL